MTLTFGPDGSWVRRSDSTISSGMAVVDGGTIVWRADDGTTSSSSISLGGGTLYLDDYSYLRLDASGPGGSAVVGSWIESSSYFVTLHLDGSGVVVVDDQVNGTVSGTYTISGSTIEFAVPGWSAAPVQWSVDSGTLTLTTGDGSSSTWFRSG